MKRILLGAVLCFFSSMQINAQSFSEEQLDGEWKLTSAEVDFNDYIGAIKLLKFGFFLDKHHGQLHDVAHQDGGSDTTGFDGYNLIDVGITKMLAKFFSHFHH